MNWQDRLDEFVCLRCDHCCRGDGHVWVTEADIRRIAKHLELTRAAFLKRYTRRAEGDLALVDGPGADKPCVFYEPGHGCRINAIKPRQCIAFPTHWGADESLDLCKGLQALAASTP